MTGEQPSSALRTQALLMYVIRPESVDALWQAEEPSTVCQKLLLEHIEDVQAASGVDWKSWDETEMRFEQGELKWIADYMINALVFIKTELKIETAEHVSHIL